MLEVTVRGQQDLIICKQQRGDPETPKPDLLPPRLLLDILSMKTTNRTGDEGQIWWRSTPTVPDWLLLQV